MDANVPSFSFGAGTSVPAARGRTPGKGKPRSAKPINHAANAPAGSGISLGAQQKPQQTNSAGTWQANGAFAELDANQQPMFNRSRFAAEAKAAKASSPSQPAVAGAQAAPAPVSAAVPPAEDSMRTWAAMLNSLQNQKYDSPGAAAFPNRGQQHKPVAVPPQQAKAAPAAHGVAGFGSPLAPQAAAAAPAQGSWFAPPQLPTARGGPSWGAPPGSAMSMDTAMPTAAPASSQPYFSVMSVDMAATPVFSFGGAESLQPGARAAEVCHNVVQVHITCSWCMVPNHCGNLVVHCAMSFGLSCQLPLVFCPACTL
eukprot:GHUV01011034.1.p1 GENE.GHUV01011034.1~~GHUV01011034.1.p1  ORF type:complete len:313 (+),score=80.85 GHUV01011034.1:1220-2158(+)